MKRTRFLGALTRKAIADVLRRPVRTGLVILGIVVGVFGLTAINVANDTTYRALAFSESEANIANATFFTKQVDASILPTLTAIPHVAQAQIATYYATRWQVRAAPGHVNINIYAFPDVNHIALSGFQVTQGTLPGPGEIVMDFTDANLQAVKVGDTVTVDSPHGPMALRVAGISRTLGVEGAGLSNNALAYMAQPDLDQLANLTGANIVQAKVDSSDRAVADATTKAIFTTLRVNHVTVLGYSFDYQPFGAGPLPGLFAIMRALSLVALLLTALLIVNTVTTLVAEQTKIIGTMKALGGTRGAVLRSYLLSVLFYAVMGTVVGIGLGIWGGFAFAGYIATLIVLDLGPFQLAPSVLLLSLAIGLLVPLLAALIPLWTGTRISVRDAISAYGVNTGNRRGRATRFSAISQTVWMGLRGVFRRRGRAGLTLAALTLSGAAFLAISTLSYSVNQTQSQLNALYAYDVSLGLNAPQPIAKIRAELQAVPNVARVEQFTHDGVTTQWGQLVLDGVQPDTHLYRYNLLHGTWLTGNSANEIVISDIVAQKTGLHVGASFTISLPTNSQAWQIVGIVHDPSSGTGVVGIAYTTVAALTAFNQQPQDVGTGFLIQAQDRSNTAVNTLATSLDNQLSQQGLNPYISTHQQSIQRSQGQFQILFAIFSVVAGIVALVGVLGLANTLTTSVLERRREIGILRAMGATGWDVARVFWVEALTLALIAWCLGAIISVPVAAGFINLISAQLLVIPFIYSPFALVWMLAAILVIATLASFGPALSASRTCIADILRYE